ncbi:hypothetical protein HMPREF0072_0854 [Anaerococcus lactolyticus ATCC 51172]|uniref:Uncharacterized protein n=1 Tax=Anaerococcus lactolyticus ATCC 51172 TaxID=525254 RepID=C2BET4_9FIRM|nr:hypothetical protein HMPREF0072_0854 [Anaerococcus lactolyticus ATCC 51172]
MILTPSTKKTVCTSCTRTSGDDPGIKMITITQDTVVPAQAGMILMTIWTLPPVESCTRTSGDDPN